MKIVTELNRLANWLESRGESAAEIRNGIKEIEALGEVAAMAKPMLDYIEMKIAHQGCMSVKEIQEALKTTVQQTASVTTAHHLGCSVTSRFVDLERTRAAIRHLDKLQAK